MILAITRAQTALILRRRATVPMASRCRQGRRRQRPSAGLGLRSARESLPAPDCALGRHFGAAPEASPLD